MISEISSKLDQENYKILSLVDELNPMTGKSCTAITSVNLTKDLAIEYTMWKLFGTDHSKHCGLLTKKFKGLKLEINGLFVHHERKLASSKARQELNLHEPNSTFTCVVVGDACSKFSLLRDQLKGTTNPLTFYTLLVRLPSYWFPMTKESSYLNDSKNYFQV